MGSRTLLKLVAWGGRALALVSLLVALVWVAGPAGTNTIFDQHVPEVAGEVARQINVDSFATPSSPFLPAQGFSYEDVPGVTVSGESFTGLAIPGTTEIVSGTAASFLAPSTLQRVGWSLVHALPPFLMALVWWSVAGIASRSIASSPFSARNGRALARLGGALVLAALVQSLAGYGIRRWMLATSAIGDVTTFPFSMRYLPWTTLAFGLGLMTLSVVWRRGVELEEDVEGLV